LAFRLLPLVADHTACQSADCTTDQSPLGCLVVLFANNATDQRSGHATHQSPVAGLVLGCAGIC
jgi:hypothetical protein